jgi:hypothetical protein
MSYDYENTLTVSLDDPKVIKRIVEAYQQDLRRVHPVSKRTSSIWKSNDKRQNRPTSHEKIWRGLLVELASDKLGHYRGYGTLRVEHTQESQFHNYQVKYRDPARSTRTRLRSLGGPWL